MLKDTEDQSIYRYNHWIWRELVPRTDDSDSESDEDVELRTMMTIQAIIKL